MADTRTMYHRFVVSHVKPSTSPSPSVAEHGCKNHALFLSMSWRSNVSVIAAGGKAGRDNNITASKDSVCNRKCIGHHMHS